MLECMEEKQQERGSGPLCIFHIPFPYIHLQAAAPYCNISLTSHSTIHDPMNPTPTCNHLPIYYCLWGFILLLCGPCRRDTHSPCQPTAPQKDDDTASK